MIGFVCHDGYSPYGLLALLPGKCELKSECSAYELLCDASKWRLGTTAVVPGLPPLARDAVVPARHSLSVLSSTRAPLRNPGSGSC